MWFRKWWAVSQRVSETIIYSSGGISFSLGQGQHTQYSLKAPPEFNYTIISVALGQDHTLALTKSGEVLSWGLNRFHQLGYVMETISTPGRLDEPIQSVPRKVYGALKKEQVRGVAACKTASACWTDKEVFTWGTNNGQLGYDKTAQPVQILPRKVTKVSRPVVALAVSVRMPSNPHVLKWRCLLFLPRIMPLLVFSTPEKFSASGMIDISRSSNSRSLFIYALNSHYHTVVFQPTHFLPKSTFIGLPKP